MISSKRRCCGRSPMRGFGNRDRTFEAGSWPSCATSSSHRLRSQSARRRHLRCWASRTSDRRRTSARRDWRCAMPGRRSAVCRVSSARQSFLSASRTNPTPRWPKGWELRSEPSASHLARGRDRLRIATHAVDDRSPRPAVLPECRCASRSSAW
jgi:hypothetical protein